MERDLGRLEKTGAGMEKSIGGSLKSVGGKMQAVGGTMSKFVTLPLAAAAVASVKFAADYDQSLTNAVSVTGKTGKAAQAAKKDMDGLAKSLGQETAFSAKEAADAMYDLASSGWDAQDMGKGLRGIMDLAAATQSDLATTTETVTSTLGQFGLKAGDSGRVADVFTKAIGSSKANMDRLSASFKTVGPVAHALGIPLEDTTAILSKLYDAGFEGETAGTALRGALSSLMNPVGQTKEGLKALGVSMDDVNPKTNSFTDILKTLKDAGMDANTATQIFGREAAPAMLAVADKGPAIDKLAGSLKNAGGAAKQVADQQLNTLSGQLKILGGSLQTAAITVGQKFLPALKGIVSFLTPLVNRFSSLSPAVLGVVVGIAAFAAALGPLLVVAGMVVSALGSLVLVTGVGVVASLGLAAAAVAPFVVAAAALAAVGILIWRNWSKVKAAFQPLTPIVNQVKATLNSLKTVIGGLINGKSGTEAFRKAFASLPGPIQAAIKRIVVAWRGLKTAFSQAKAVILPILKQIASGIKTGLVTAFKFLLGQGRQLVAWFKANWPQIKAAVLPVLKTIGQAIRTVLVAGFKFAVQQAKVVVNWFKQNWPLIKQTAVTVFNAIKAVVGTVMKFVWNGIIKPIVGAIVSFWKANWDSVKAILQSVWTIIKSVVKTAIKTVLNLIKLGMQVITGDWKGAWQTIKNILKDQWENIKTIVKEVLKILWEVIKTAWSNVKSLTKAAWKAVKNEIDDRISSARTRVKKVVGQLKSLLSSAWDGIKSATKTAWEGIQRVMEDPMRAAHQTIVDIWNALLDGIQGVLEKLGMDKAAKAVGGAFLSGPKQKATPQVSQGGRGPNQAFARGGLNRPGGMADSDTILYGEAGPEAYVRLDKKTPQSQAAARAVMRSPNAPEVARTHRRAGRGNRQEGFGPATYTLVKPLKEIAEKIAAKFGTPWNSYMNHPPNQPTSNQPYWRERSVDWWGGGGRGDPIGSVWTGVASEAKSMLGGNLEYMLDPNNDPAGHWDHVHVSAFIGQDGLGTAKGSGGAGGGVSKWISSGAEKAFDALMKNIIDPAAKKMGTGNTLLGSMGANLLKTQLGEAMGDYLSQKFAGGSGGAAGSNAGSVKDMIKRGLEQSGAFPATSSNIDTMYGRAMQESGGDVNAVNNWDSNAARGTPSKGLFQVIEPTWEANREGEFGPFSSNWNKGDSSAGVAANYMKSQYGRIVGASGTGYTDGGMPTKPHKALVEPHDLFLPLDNQRVMQSAQTALGTAELRSEMRQMRKTLNDTLVRQERQMVNVKQWAKAQEAATRQAIGSGRADDELSNYILKVLD